MQIFYDNETFRDASYTKFLCIPNDYKLYWRNNIEKLTNKINTV